MKKSNLIKVMMLAGILPLSVAVNGNDDNVTNPTQEQVIELTNDGNNIANNNALTGGTVTQQSMTALPGTICTVPVNGLTMGTYTVSVTNNVNGQSVSGDFQVNNNKE